MLKIVITLMGIAAVTGCTPCTSSCEVNTQALGQAISYNAFAVGLNSDGSICVPGGAIPPK